MKYVLNDQQTADILTKGSFTRDKWSEFVMLFGSVPESFQHSPLSVVAKSSRAGCSATPDELTVDLG